MTLVSPTVTKHIEFFFGLACRLNRVVEPGLDRLDHGQLGSAGASVVKPVTYCADQQISQLQQVQLL